VVGNEIEMHGGQVVFFGELDRGRGEHEADFVRVVGLRIDEQARAGNGCEGNGNDGIGVILHTDAVGSIGPAPVEDKFAGRVEFQIQGQSTDDVFWFV